jgi:hypothetical protein
VPADLRAHRSTTVLALEAIHWLAYTAYKPLLFGKRSTKLS